MTSRKLKKNVFKSFFKVAFVMLVSAGQSRANTTNHVVIYSNKFIHIGDNAPARSLVDWKSQFSQPWSDEAKLEVRSTNSNATVMVDSCQKLFKADKAGINYPSPASGYGFQQYRVVASGCYAGRVITLARPAKKSYVKNFSLNASTVRELPPDLGFFISRSDEDKLAHVKAKGLHLGHFLDGAKFTFKNAPNEKSAVVKYPDGSEQTFVLTATGDFNNDGIEDILISTANSVGERGTYRAIGLYAITKLRPGAPYTLVKAYPVGGGS